MSNTFNPGPGWIQVTEGEYISQGTGHGPRLNMEDGGLGRFWVREPPAPPLPTEPGYYAAQQPSYGETVVVELLRMPAGQWVDAGDRNYLDAAAVAAMGPLVRLEPRAVTAKAVLDRVREERPDLTGTMRVVELLACEFGVQS